MQHVRNSLVQNDPPLIFKQSLLIIGQKPYLTTYQGGGPPPKYEKKQNIVGQNAEISLVQNDPPLIFKQSLLIIGQKPYLRQTRGGRGEKMKKYKLLWCNTLKFRSFVVVTAFLINSEGGVLKK